MKLRSLILQYCKFNSFAENIFMGDESFFDTVEGYEKLEMKLDLIVEFYNALDPTFTIEYFKEIWKF